MPQVGQDLSARPLVLRDAELLGDVEDVEQMMRDPPTLGRGDFGGADVHASVHLERIGVDHLAAHLLGHLEGKVGLAHRSWPHDGHDSGP